MEVPTRFFGNRDKIHRQLRIPLQKKLEKNSKGNPSRTERSPQTFSERPRCWNATCKNKQSQNWSDANHYGHSRINMGVESISPTKPEKVRAGKHKIKYSYRLKDTLTGDHKCASAWPQMSFRLGL